MELKRHASYWMNWKRWEHLNVRDRDWEDLTSCTLRKCFAVMKPVLTWTNELTPIKQSASVMVTMFGGFGYTALLFIGYMLFPGYTLGYIRYIGIFIVVNVVAGLALYIWLKTKGCDRFVEL